MNSGEEPDLACFDKVWRMSLAVALGKWKQTLTKQLGPFNRRLSSSNWGHLYGTTPDMPVRIFPLGQIRVFGLYGDENLLLHTPYDCDNFRGRRCRRDRLRDPEHQKHFVYDLATIRELAEQASWELYRTDNHLAALEFATIYSSQCQDPAPSGIQTS